MTMPRARDRDASREIQKQVAVHIFNDRAAAARAYQGIDARVRRRHVTLVTLERGEGLGAGELGMDVGNSALVEEPHRDIPHWAGAGLVSGGVVSGRVV